MLKYFKIVFKNKYVNRLRKKRGADARAAFHQNIHPGYFWSNASDILDSSEMDQYKYDAIKLMFQENLQHARHVENQRLTYHAFYAALVAGGLAFVSMWGISREALDVGVALIICFMMIALGILTVQLYERWTYVFERHFEYAKGCYYLLHRELFGIEEERIIKEEDSDENFQLEKNPSDQKCKQKTERLGLDVLPLFCFRMQGIDDIFANHGNNARAKVLFKTFDMIILYILRIVLGILVYRLLFILSGMESIGIFSSAERAEISAEDVKMRMMFIFIAVLAGYLSKRICQKVEIIMVRKYGEK